MRLTPDQRRELAKAIDNAKPLRDSWFAFDYEMNRLTDYGTDLVSVVETFLTEELGHRDPSIDIVEGVDPATRRLSQEATEGFNDGRVLAWCAVHEEPAWRFEDGSSACLSVDEDSREGPHVIVDGPWELPAASVFTRRR